MHVPLVFATENFGHVDVLSIASNGVLKLRNAYILPTYVPLTFPNVENSQPVKLVQSIVTTPTSSLFFLALSSYAYPRFLSTIPRTFSPDIAVIRIVHAL
jgi:hypothetical protein